MSPPTIEFWGCGHESEPPIIIFNARKLLCKTCSHRQAHLVADWTREHHNDRYKILCTRLESVQVEVSQAGTSLQDKNQLLLKLCSRKSCIPQKRIKQNNTIKELEQELPKLRSRLEELKWEQKTLEKEKANLPKLLNRKIEKVWSGWYEVWVPKDDRISQTRV